MHAAPGPFGTVDWTGRQWVWFASWQLCLVNAVLAALVLTGVG